MSNLFNQGVNTNKNNNETQVLPCLELEDVNSAADSLNSPYTSAEAARQFKPATDPPSKQLERLCNRLKELHQAPLKRKEETLGLIQGSSKAHNHRFDTQKI